MLVVWLTCVHLGCLSKASQTCGNGGVCPPGLLCVDTSDTTAGHQICAVGTCGNGRLDPGESCDDGNNRSGDGCPADCTQPCGDGVRDPGEACDDGNTVDGDGCAADCQSVDGVLDVSPSMISLTALEGDPQAAVATVTVRPPYHGDTVVMGYAPGVAQPDWLALAEGPSRDGVSELQLRALDNLVVGLRTTSVRLTITHPNSTGLETFDLPVSYRVEPAALAIEALPASLTFTAAVGDITVASQTVAVAFNGDDVALRSAPAWLTVAAATVTGSPASFTVSVNRTSLTAGTTLTDDVVFVTTAGTVQREIRVPVDYHMVAPPVLAIAASPIVMTFSAVAGDAPPPGQLVTVTFTGTGVEVVTAPPWITLTPIGPVTSPATFMVSINSTAFVAGTAHLIDLVIGTMRGAAQQLAVVHVEYDVLVRPEVQFVAPHVGIAGSAGTVRVRGRGFPSLVTVRLGDLALGPVTPDSATQITLSYPALPEGHYPVTLVDPTAVAPTAPELVIVAPTTLDYHVITAPGMRSRIVYDAERRAIYGVNLADEQIDHFVFSAGMWSSVAPTVVPRLSDLAMEPDGRSLLVVAQTAIDEMSLTDGLFTPVPRVTFPGSGCELFTEAAMANNGKALVLTGNGICPVYLYDLRDQSLSVVATFDGGGVGASGDGSQIYAGTDLPGPFRIYDSLTCTLSTSAAFGASSGDASVSDDASRVILGATSVFGRSLDLIGGLPYHGSNAVLVSHDSSRAFVYAEDDPGPRLEVYDLDSPVDDAGLYPLLETILLPDAANATFPHDVRMTSSPDDAVVFVSGNGRLLVVPVR